MTFNGHTKITLASVAALFILQPNHIMDLGAQATLIFTGALIVGNFFPDLAEMKIIPHRTYTHYPLFYLLLGTAGWLGVTNPDLILEAVSIPNLPLYSVGVLGMAIGALTHIACDWPFYSGIPLFKPTRSVALTKFTFDGGLNNTIENVVAFGIVFGALAMTWTPPPLAT